MNIVESYSSRIQDVFIRHLQDSSHTPISRDAFIHSGWNQQTYLIYYRFTHMLYFSYVNYHYYLSASQTSSDSKETKLLRQNAHLVLEDSCANLAIFFKKFIDFPLDSSALLSHLDSLFSLESSEDNFSDSYHRFLYHLESFVGVQLGFLKSSRNVQNLFASYYRSHSRSFIDSRSTISKKDFLSASWTPQTYHEYYTLTSNLYCSLLLSKNQAAPSEDFILWENKLTRSTAKNASVSILLDSFHNLYHFLKDHLSLELCSTADLFYLLGIKFQDPENPSCSPYTGSCLLRCHPYDKPYTLSCNPCDTLVFFASYEQFLSWLEYEIGSQIANAPVEPSEIDTTLQPREIPVDSPWYKLPYHELQKYRLENTWAARENARTELLYFNDFMSPDSSERFWKLIFDFLAQDSADENVCERLDEYEDCNFDVDGDVLYIYKGETKCFQEHHDIEPVTATVLARRGNTVDININCCCDCHKYFISESEFFHYRDLYGIVCRLNVDRHSSGYAKFPMAEYSVLRLYGYNVGKEDNLSDSERQTLLKILIEHEYVKKPEIIKYLEMFIKMNRGRLEMTDSVSKWTADLAYVRELGLASQPKVLLNKIEYAH